MPESQQTLTFEAHYIQAFRRAPWDWDVVTPGPGDTWHGPGPFWRHQDLGVIIQDPDFARLTPSEGESMESKQTIGGTGVSTVHTLAGIHPGPNAFPDARNYYKSEVKLGQTYREEDTGFEGVAQAIYFYRNACERVELERYSKKLGLESLVFDAKRLSLVNADGTVEKVADAKAPGGPDRGNPRRSTPNR